MLREPGANFSEGVEKDLRSTENSQNESHLHWMETMQQLLSSKLLRSVAVDELHLYTAFGLTFRKEFYKLKNSLFRLITNYGGNVKIPLLLMTATCTEAILSDFRSMTGIAVHPNDAFWGSMADMQHRTVSLKVHYCDRPKDLSSASWRIV